MKRISHMHLLSLSLTGNNKLTHDPHCKGITTLIHTNTILIHTNTILIHTNTILIHTNAILIHTNAILILLLLILSLSPPTDRYHVIDIIPHVWMLDGQLVTGIERERERGREVISSFYFLFSSSW